MLVGLVSGLYLEQSVEHSVPREQPLRTGCLEHGATQPFILFDCHSAISQPLEWQRGGEGRSERCGFEFLQDLVETRFGQVAARLLSSHGLKNSTQALQAVTNLLPSPGKPVGRHAGACICLVGWSLCARHRLDVPFVLFFFSSLSRRRQLRLYYIHWFDSHAVFSGHDVSHLAPERVR